MNSYAEQAYDVASSLNDLYEKNTGVQSYEQLAEMAAQQNKLIEQNRAAYEEFKKEMETQLANGQMAAGSEELKKAQTDLANLQSQLIDAELEIKNINEAIREVNWSNWNNALKMLEHMNSQLDSTIDIIGSLTSYNDDASITGAGVAQFDLYSSALANARKQVAEYSEAIEALDKDLADGMINQQQYNEELMDYREKQMAAVKSVKQYRDAIIDLVKKGIDAETEAMSELIDKRKEALKKQKEADDYARTVNDKTKEINKIRAQIAALSGDETLATQAKIANLRAQLADKEQDLADTRRDHEYDEITKAYDDELDKFKELQDEKSKALEYSLANQEVAIQSALEYTTSQYEKTYAELGEITKAFGISLEDFIINPWRDGASAVEEYTRAVAEATTTEQHFSETNRMGNAANNGSGTPITTGNAQHASTETSSERFNETIQQPWTASYESNKGMSYSPASNGISSIGYRDNGNGTVTMTIDGISPEDVANIHFATWSKEGGQDDLVWYTGTYKDGRYEATIDRNKHLHDGTYYTHIYETDKSGKQWMIGDKTYELDANAKKIPGSFSGNLLQQGSTATAEVRYLQQLLNAVDNAGLTVDGDFGPATRQAVINFQKKYGLQADGTVGNETRPKLLALAKSLGYARHGRRNAKGFYITDEEGLGSEAIITKQGVLRQLDSDTVFSKAQTEELWKLSKMNILGLLKNSGITNRAASVNVNYGSLLTVNGNVDREALPELKDILKQACEYTKRDMTQTFTKMGWRVAF